MALYWLLLRSLIHKSFLKRQLRSAWSPEASELALWNLKGAGDIIWVTIISWICSVMLANWVYTILRLYWIKMKCFLIQKWRFPTGIKYMRWCTITFLERSWDIGNCWHSLSNRMIKKLLSSLKKIILSFVMSRYSLINCINVKQ